MKRIYAAIDAATPTVLVITWLILWLAIGLLLVESAFLR
jgi:hypothetical protein